MASFPIASSLARGAELQVLRAKPVIETGGLGALRPAPSTLNLLAATASTFAKAIATSILRQSADNNSTI